MRLGGRRAEGRSTDGAAADRRPAVDGDRDPVRPATAEEVESAVELLVEDAIVDGDQPVRRGGARAAFSYPTFRRVYLGALLSNIGSWMQTVILGAFIYHQTGSATYVALGTLAQLGPLLLLSIPGGAIADRFDRRTVLVVVSVEQLAFSLAIAALVDRPSPNIALLLGCILAIGIGQAVYAPAYSALIPTLVDRKDMAGAISLNSANMNLSRVIGPAIGGILYAKVGASWVFVGNAVTYLFIIGALWGVHLPAGGRRSGGEPRAAAARGDTGRPTRSGRLPVPQHHGPVLVLLPARRRAHAGARPRRPRAWTRTRSPTGCCTRHSGWERSSVRSPSGPSSSNGTWPRWCGSGSRATPCPSGPSP